MSAPIPIIDLFAGPGGLGEGFASLKDDRGQPAFRIGLSIEMESSAHNTLTLRAVFRQLRETAAMRAYYDYVRGRVTLNEFRSIPAVAAAFERAHVEARRYELGETDQRLIDAEIRAALGGEQSWVLIGGPPCQAYSLAGRSRRANDKTFGEDKKHFLYREYLRIINVHRPAIFVMENVKGLLSSQHSGAGMFPKIMKDLSRPSKGLEYEIRSFVNQDAGFGLTPGNYVVEAERFGVPQTRHRVILLGVRRNCDFGPHDLLVPVPEPITVRSLLDECVDRRWQATYADTTYQP